MIKKSAVTLARLSALVALIGVSPVMATTVSVRGFEGTSQLDNCALGQCFRPPDTMGAVGTTQFLETTNGSITVYNKGTGAVESRLSMPTFWANAGLSGGAGGDQRVLFDHYTSRWIAIGFGPTGNVINIGVSVTDNAAGAWKSTSITALPSGTADYPTLGMDSKGVYIGTNNFNVADNFTGTSLLVIPKADLFGVTPTTVNMTNFTTPLAAGDRGFAIQAAVKWDGNATNTASIIADSRDLFQQVFYKVNGVDGPGATQTATQLIAGTAYSPAGDGRQPDGTRLVDTLDARVSANAVQIGDKIYSATTIRSSVGDFSAIRWTVVDANTGVLLSNGRIETAGFDYYQASIAVNEFGQAVIGYNRSGAQTGDTNGDGKADGNISFMARAFSIDDVGALTQMGDEMFLRVSDISDYRCGLHSTIDLTCRQRWGDFSAVSFDPLDHHKFYAIGEYAAEWAVIPDFTTTPRAIWHTYISEIGFAEIPEPENLALFGIALAALGTVRRRRRSSLQASSSANNHLC